VKLTTALWLIVVALVTAAVAVFAVSNAQPVQIRFVGWEPAPSLALLVIGAFLCGGVLVAGLSLPGRIRLGLRLRALQRQLAAMPPEAAEEGAAAPTGEGATAGRPDPGPEPTAPRPPLHP
jgi:uncharacterized integral membrane protein